MDKTMHNKISIVIFIITSGSFFRPALALSEKLPLVLVRSYYA